MFKIPQCIHSYLYKTHLYTLFLLFPLQPLFCCFENRLDLVSKSIWKVSTMQSLSFDPTAIKISQKNGFCCDYFARGYCYYPGSNYSTSHVWIFNDPSLDKKSFEIIVFFILDLKYDIHVSHILSVRIHSRVILAWKKCIPFHCLVLLQSA